MPNTPIVPTETRHENRSATMPVITRPAIPPIAVPPTYSPHRESEPVGVNLLREIRHRDGGHAAERDSFERAQPQQRMPVRRERDCERQQ